MMEKNRLEDSNTRLKHEFLAGIGFVEADAIAFTAAKAREALGKMPEQMVIRCSRNTIENSAGLIIEKTGAASAIEIAAILGILAANAAPGIQLIGQLKEPDITKARYLLSLGICRSQIDGGAKDAYIRADLISGEETATVISRGRPGQITRVEKNGQIILQ
jgi:L-cysteine desulfidase